MQRLWQPVYVSLRGLVRAVRSCQDAGWRLYLRLVLGRCGKGLQTQRPFVILAPGQVEFGEDVSFNAYLHIWGTGGVKIGNRVLIASHVAITSSTHDPSAPVMMGTIVHRPVIIEDDVWIGAHSVILPGVHVGHGAVIAAGAVVTRDVPAECTVAGVPARIVKADRRMAQIPNS
jgi:acetyltransferase-like isoleucine patch superfamily enzyme